MSQVTKPIALDETLQDVADAIRDITQGGMIVSTGNVGSATQPVYINGGVPTAGNEVMAAFRASAYVSNLDNAPVGFATFTSNATNAPHTAWGAVMTYIIFDHSDYEIQVASKYNTDDLWSRVKNNGTWTSWRQISGITTGTPTSANSNCSIVSGRGEVKKSGNIVEINVQLNIDTAFTPNENTRLFTVPFKPATYWPLISRISGSASSPTIGMAEINPGNGDLIWGLGPYSQLSAGTSVWIRGTYLTND
jgi:hypothetical protein